jgi:hypothetical protein
MDALSFDDLNQRMERLHGRYMLHFADKTRLTRDPLVLSELLEEVTALKHDCGQVSSRSDELDALEAKAVERTDLYKREIKLVHEAQAAGPAVIEATRLRATADGIRRVYQRNFAGRARGTCDRRLLAEISRQMSQGQKALFTLYQAYPSIEGLGDTLESVNGWLELYRKETQLISEAYSAGGAMDRFAMLANRANGQFECYQRHFAGKGRLSRRLDLMLNVIANLKDIDAAMKRVDLAELDADPREHHKKNQGIVSDRLAFYRTELRQIEEVRGNKGPHERAEAIARSISDALAIYNKDFAGQDRHSRDLSAIAALCDEVAVASWSLREFLEETSSSAAIARHVSFAEDILDLLDREHRLISEIQTA